MSHIAIVHTIEVTYPNGLVPTSEASDPANSIKSHALRKNVIPAAGSLVNDRIFSPSSLVGRRDTSNSTSDHITFVHGLAANHEEFSASRV